MRCSQANAYSSASCSTAAAVLSAPPWPALRSIRSSTGPPVEAACSAAVAGFFARHHGWIVEASHHADPENVRYFLRQEVLADSLPFGREELFAKFQPIADEFQMEWRLWDTAVKKRVALLVSTQDHCLYDLLGRWHGKELDLDVGAVISNHDVLRGLVEFHGLPFHHVDFETLGKPAAFAEVRRLIEQARCDTVVLARFMQIVPPDLCQAFLAASSTSTTASCLRSSARGPTTRPTRGA